QPHHRSARERPAPDVTSGRMRQDVPGLLPSSLCGWRRSCTASPGHTQPEEETMATDNVISTLNDLIQLDVDAVNAYEQAIERIDIPQVAADLEQFKGDHQRHIEELSAEVMRLGGEPPDRSPDLKGYLLEGFTALRSVTGTEGALKAMRSNEVTTNK